MCASKIVLQLLFFFSGFGLTAAERRTQGYHQHVLATLGDEADFGKAMQAAKPCPQEKPLKEVLLTLGFKESELTDLHDMVWRGDKGVKWWDCKVVKIDLEWRQEVTGPLSPRFSELPDLRYLNLRRTKVSGDIKALQNLTELWKLSLVKTKVSGNIAALENLRELEWLSLVETNVIGDIGALKNLTRLKELKLSKTHVSGNIEALKNLTKLTYLDLGSANVIGDMSAWRNLGEFDMSGFHIKGTKITCQDAALRAVLRSLGLQAEQLTDLMHFKGVKRRHNCWVVEIDLSNRSDVSGSLDKDFQELKYLKRLNLENTKTSGDIALLRNNTKLDYLNLQNTSVFGDLAAFQKATRLTFRNFEVSNTNITCPQEAALKAVLIKLGFKEQQLQDLHAMEELAWRNCMVTEINLRSRREEVNGALDERFGELEDLERLHLASSKASGDITLLRNNTKLKHLHMSGTRVSGDISTILSWKKIQSVDLSGTGVVGQLDGTWKGCCQELQNLKLAEVVELKVVPPQAGEKHSWMPKLTNLDLTGSPVNLKVSSLLKWFQHCSYLGSLQAGGCGLRGRLDGRDGTPSLVALDLGWNHLTHVDAVPPGCKSLILTGTPHITFAPGILQGAIKDRVFLDLQNVSFDEQEAEELFKENVVQETVSQTMFDREGRFACFDLTSSQLEITPNLFAPKRLCSCNPGWNGSGTQCKMCPPDHFKNDTSVDCMPCPEGSTAPNGSTSHENCKCKVGELIEKNGEWLCGCPAHQARLEESCFPCADLHLDCSLEGSTVVSARALPGFARVGNENRSFRCLPPEQRCHSVQSFKMSKSACADGYVGVMCMDCASNFYAAGRACKECQDYDLEFPNPWLFAPVIVIVIVVLALWLWRWRNTEPEVQVQEVRCKSFFTEFKEQIQAQGPILLQHCQLWAVLAALRKTTDASSCWEIPYIETLQFSLSSLKGALNLQCKFDGPTVRLGFALMAPVVPLLVISSCLILEVFSTGSGITTMLKAITILYIGGASGTSSLLTCQDLDGNQEPLPADYTFRSATPAILCAEHTNMKIWVDIIGYVCAFGYAIVIPTLMLYLFYRQRVVLRSSRMITGAAACDGDLKVCLHEVKGSTTERISRQDEAFFRRLVATAVSYISTLYRGRRVRLQLTDGFAIVTPIGVERGQSQGLDGLDVLVSSVLESEDAKDEIDTLTGITIAEMLRERCALQEVIEGDRVLRGAQNLLCKYRIGNNLWMEVVQKLVAVALVSMVTSANGLQNCLGINLGMAAACAMVQAYARPQVNLLQSFCFLCLALATLSFYYGWVWSSRAAFALPFVVMAVQGLRPDSPETLALRLWQELDTKMPALQKGEAVEISAETFSFI